MNRAFGCIIDTVCRSPRDRGAPLVKLLHTLGPRLAKLPADQLESLMRCQQFFECHGARYRSVLEPVGLAGNGATPRNGRVWERYDVHCRVQCTLANGEQCRQSGCVTREMSMRGFYAPECREPANAVLRSVRLRIPKKRHRSHVRVEVSQCRVVATHASEQLAGRGVLIDHIGDGQGDRLYAAMKELAGRRD